MSTPRRHRPLRLVALAGAALVTVALAPAALADGNRPVIPSKQQVANAEQHVATAKQSVSQIEAELAAANHRLQQLGIAADKAAEAYNGAMLRWHQARAAAAAAERRADRAEAQANRSRGQLAGYVVSHDTAGSDLTALSTALSATGPKGLLDQMASYDASSQALDAHFQAWQADSALAKVYRAQAEKALKAAAQAKQAAARAKAAAEHAVAAQQAAVSSMATQRASLLKQLARAEHISVRLATQRQQGLEELRQQRLERQRRLEALRIKREEEQRAAELRRQREEQRRQQQQRQHQDPPSTPPSQPPSQPPAPPTPPPPPPAPPAPPAGAAQTAIAFARAQLGDPYVWGASGPDAWDCSGLTMGSWAAAGVYLPHYSVSQYYATTPITFAQLRPGDLVFWGGSSPNTIYHVAIYIGNDQIIQAPHTGAYVEVSSIYDWILPNYFGRP